jgi:hypothetical protein
MRGIETAPEGVDNPAAPSPVLRAMTADDQRALEEIRAWQSRKPARRLRGALPAPVRERAREFLGSGRRAGELVTELPGVEQVTRALSTALEGTTRTIGAAAGASVSTGSVIRRYRRAGHAIERIEDIQGLELAASDHVFPRRKRLAYVAAAGAQGGVAGAATTVSTTATVATGVFGAGAGGVPTAIVTAGVVAADITATLLATSRIVAETSALYGYDPNDPAEQVFMAGVVGAATASSEGAKLAAQRELRELAKLLARRAPYSILDQHVFTHVVRKAYAKLGERMTQRQLGKVVPLASIAIGAGVNAALMHRTADEAYFAYRERRLIERYGDVPVGDPVADEVIVDAEVIEESAESLEIVALLETAKTEGVNATAPA